MRRRTRRLQPNRRRGGILFGLLVSALVVGCVAITVGMYVARNVRVQTTSRNSDYVSIDTPVGHFSIHAHDKGAVPADIPIYPGARPMHDSGGGAVFQWDSNDGAHNGGFAVSGSEMMTSDRLGKVVDYYRTQLPNWIIVNDREGGVHFEFHEGGYKHIIGIRERYDGTHIGVASIGEPASN